MDIVRLHAFHIAPTNKSSPIASAPLISPTIEHLNSSGCNQHDGALCPDCVWRKTATRHTLAGLLLQHIFVYIETNEHYGARFKEQEPPIPCESYRKSARSQHLMVYLNG